MKKKNSTFLPWPYRAVTYDQARTDKHTPTVWRYQSYSSTYIKINCSLWYKYVLYQSINVILRDYGQIKVTIMFIFIFDDCYIYLILFISYWIILFKSRAEEVPTYPWFIPQCTHTQKYVHIHTYHTTKHTTHTIKIT